MKEFIITKQSNYQLTYILYLLLISPSEVWFSIPVIRLNFDQLYYLAANP
ncbi:MAG: hypothetical protein IPO39_09095 [Bacteroidetes bacterium]|nr:hypothetical protein [Bacteroidota bacterium]MBK9543064.1 hypothetical protein [Bacteroidota bacterium]